MSLVSTSPSSADALREPLDLPLVVDLDGTLLRSDMLVETLSSVVAHQPLAGVSALGALGRGRAAFKQHLARKAQVNVARLPWNDQLIDLIVAERARGRPVYLASASDRKLVEQVAQQLALFDGVFSSDGELNLKGSAKAAALCEAFGERGFIYAGDEKADFPVWEKAAGVIVVNAAPAVVRRALSRWPAAKIIDARRVQPRKYLKAIRVHQWLKNLLLAVPALAAHRFGLADMTQCLIGFLSFSLCASSVYVMNDLVDLNRDRAHPRKRNRPFAAGAVPVLHGGVLIPLLLSGGILLALTLSPKFLLVLAVYYATTVAYSLFLKQQMILDVVTLACLYGVRLVAGGVAVELSLSAWLVTFSIFLFTSLALVKRCTELIHRMKAELGDPPGRDYRLSDLPMLEGLAAAAGFTAIVVFSLYMKSDDVVLLYSHPNRLWLISVILIYWISRVLLLTNRGEMNDDPVIFAVTDRTSLACGLACLAVIGVSL